MQAMGDKDKGAALAEDMDTYPPLIFIPQSHCKALYQPTLQVLEAEDMDADADEATLLAVPRLHLSAE
jgi:hypothetical protein